MKMQCAEYLHFYNDNEREFIQCTKHYGADAVVRTELSLNAVGSRHR